MVQRGLPGRETKGAAQGRRRTQRPQRTQKEQPSPRPCVIPASRLSGIRPHRRTNLHLHGVHLACPKRQARGQLTMLPRNGAARRPRCTIMGLVAASQGPSSFGGKNLRPCTRRHRGLATSLRARRERVSLPTLMVKRNMVLAARSASTRQMDEARHRISPPSFPGGREVLEPPRRQAQRRPEADGGREPRHRRAARKLLIVDEPSKASRPAIINNMIEAFQQLKARA